MEVAVLCGRRHDRYYLALFLVPLSEITNRGLVPHGRRKANDESSLRARPELGLLGAILVQRMLEGVHGSQVVCILLLSVLHQHLSLRLDHLSTSHRPGPRVHVSDCKSHDGTYLYLRLDILPDSGILLGPFWSERAFPARGPRVPNYWLRNPYQCRQP